MNKQKCLQVVIASLLLTSAATIEAARVCHNGQVIKMSRDHAYFYTLENEGSFVMNKKKRSKCPPPDEEEQEAESKEDLDDDPDDDVADDSDDDPGEDPAEGSGIDPDVGDDDSTIADKPSVPRSAGGPEIALNEGDAITFAICDSRDGEKGRTVGINFPGRVATMQRACN